MGKFYESIPPEIIPWLLKQELFWVATAPLSPEAHVNVSPKGVRDSFHVVSPTRVWYQDLSGSGVETISHLRENGRVTLMFSAFVGPPRIVRLFGTGTVYEFGSREYDELIPPEQRRPGSRAAIVVDIHKVGSSCGYAVPYYEFKGHRSTLLEFFDKRERAEQQGTGPGLKAYWEEKNLRSIDGLPGLAAAPQAARMPEYGPGMRTGGAVAEGASGNGCVNGSANGSAQLVKAQNGGGGDVGVAVKTAGAGTGRRRVEELAVAFALGIAVAAVYVKASGAL